MAISTAVDVSAVARVVGIKTEFKDLRGGGILFLPQRLAVVGQGSSLSVYSTTKRQITSALEAGTVYGFGSPLHLAILRLFPVNGDGVGTIPVTVYPLQDDASGVAAAGDVTPSGTATKAGSFRVNVNGTLSEAFVISSGDVVATVVTSMTAAINAVLDIPLIATDNTTKVDFIAKWEGTSSNDLIVSIEGPTNTGITFVVTQATGGLVNPDVQPALDQVGDVWETMMLNCLNIEDSTALATYNTFGEGRWGALVRKPLVVFTGTNELDVDTAIIIPEANKTDRVDSQLVAPGSINLPLQIAARQVARIIRVANSNPPQDYGSQDASNLEPGTDGTQWTFPERDQAVKGGSSTIEVKDGVINVSDVVTFFHPTGDPTPAYRYVVDIVKLQQIIFNLDLIFANAEWDGAPLIPDDQPTSNRLAKKPKTAVAEVSTMLDSLGLNAIISDPDTAKGTILAEIDSGNPKRLNITVTVQLSGNVNIISIDLNFGFFFGQTTLVA